MIHHDNYAPKHLREVRVRVSRCRPSRGIYFSAEQPPGIGTPILNVILVILLPCQWGSHPESHPPKLMMNYSMIVGKLFYRHMLFLRDALGGVVIQP